MNNVRRLTDTRTIWYGVGIILASLLAHGGCIKSIFFLDDAPGITQNPLVVSGEFWKAGLSSWTILGYVIQERIFGLNSWGFHLVNWLLHTSCALILWILAKNLLGEAWPRLTAWCAAVLFAIHPLASEIPNYARTQDLAWVTLFSLAGCLAAFAWLRDGKKWQVAVCLMCIFGATFSKGPGLFHAGMMIGAVVIAYAKVGHWRALKRAAAPLSLCVVVILLGMFFTGGIDPIKYGMGQWSEPRFIGHAYTIARVFWEFAWRCVLPIKLSADHHIAETLVSPNGSFLSTEDGVAQIAMLGMIGVCAWCLWLAWKPKTRIIGIAFLLAAGSIAFRVLYLIPEFMPEYRIYPGMPWFCLGAACVICRIQWLPQKTTWAILGIICITLSAKRSWQWHDLDRLLDDVLEQYPTQARAIWELHDRDLAAHNYQKIIQRQEQQWPKVATAFHAENKRLAPARELPTGHFALAEVASSGRYARALAASGNVAGGLQEIERMTRWMQQLGMHPVAHSIHWHIHRIDHALVLEAAGNDQAALVLLEQATDDWDVIKHRERLRKKLGEKNR
ncbi:MAG: hypothetical protein EAZ42_02535 [Verrucomicrobia bacterium]|nr:MAG: hypothetical protein EAZ42_02535 [Verrucomicrobiota bacterium]